jgi:hypothetical protein
VRARRKPTHETFPQKTDKSGDPGIVPGASRYGSQESLPGTSATRIEQRLYRRREEERHNDGGGVASGGGGESGNSLYRAAYLHQHNSAEIIRLLKKAGAHEWRGPEETTR